MQLPIETLLQGGKYKIISKISQGNFGITYLAEQTSLERKVCIKEFFFRGSCERALSGHVTVTSSGQEVTNSFLRKFMREAKRLSQFDHPNIVKVIDVFEENGTAYMVMDYVESETLQQLVDRQGKLSEKEALDYMIPICNALEVIHQKDLYHLDIKPSNILIKKQTNSPFLIDFGISKFTEASGQDHSTTTPVALTKGYAPLEQYGQDITKLTELTDVYAVAATLYKLVTGVTPPEASLIVQDGIKSPKKLNPDLSAQLSSIILKSLSYKINDRAQSITKLKGDLLSIAINPISKAPVSPPSPVKPGSDEGTEIIGGYVIPDPKTPDKVPPFTPEPNPKPYSADKYSLFVLLIIIAVMVILLAVKSNNEEVTTNSNPNIPIPTPLVETTQSIYDFVSPYTDGMAQVRKGYKWGFINLNGNLVIPLIYDDVSVFLNGKTNVKLNGKWIEIDKNGKEVKRDSENQSLETIQRSNSTNNTKIVNEEETSIQKVERMLLGKHLLSVYWIGFDNYFGRIEFYKSDERIYCKGQHVSSDSSDKYLMISGEVAIKDETCFTISGQIITKNLASIEVETKNGEYLFYKMKGSRYWRLKSKYEITNKGYTDIDIFMK